MMQALSIKRVCLAIAVVVASATSAKAEVYPIDQFSVSVHGMPVYCTSASGQPVPFFFTDQAMIAGGGHASTVPGYGSSIRLSPTTLNSIPPRSAVMVVFHECAHVALPMGIGLGSPAQELNADCYAIKTMRDAGIVYNQATFQEAVAYVAQFPNGMARVQHMWNCVNS